MKLTAVAGLASVAIFVFATSLRSQQFQSVSISEVRSAGAAHANLGMPVEIDGVVVGDYREPGQLGGFFLQEVAQGSSHGSGGIFVQANPTAAITVGDRLRVRGVLDGAGGSVQIIPAAEQPAVEIARNGHVDEMPPFELPPLAEGVDWESLEGMLIRFSQDMVVTDTHDLARYGQVTLSAEDRLFTPTNYIDPNDADASGTSTQGVDNVKQIAVADREDRKRSVVLDDGSHEQNPLMLPLLPKNGGQVATLRLGSKIKNLTGIVTKAKGKHVVVPTTTLSVEYAERPARPDLGDPDLVVASFNVLNFFTTIDDGDNGARGADSNEELDRQRKKLTTALIELDADIVGLMELENNLQSEQNLVEALNSALGSEVFAGAGLPETFREAPGSDNAIRVGIIYRRDKVEPVADVTMVSDDAFSMARTPLVQEFRKRGGKSTVTVIANHFKSKGSRDAKDDDRDVNDGQGAYNAARREQAAALVKYVQSALATDSAKNFLILGDLNAYAQEDPIDQLRGGGLVDLLEKHSGGEQPYSFVYRGRAGCLDYVFATPDLAQNVTAAKVWHINSSEPRCFDYNLEFNPKELFADDAFRSSDHDPVLVGLRFR